MPWIISAFADEVDPSIDNQIEALQANGLSWIDLRALDDHNISDGNSVPMGRGAGKARAILRDLHQRAWQGSLTLEPHLFVSKAQLPGSDQLYKDLSRRECFDIAAKSALESLGKLNN